MEGNGRIQCGNGIALLASLFALSSIGFPLLLWGTPHAQETSPHRPLPPRAVEKPSQDHCTARRRAHRAPSPRMGRQDTSLHPAHRQCLGAHGGHASRGQSRIGQRLSERGRPPDHRRGTQTLSRRFRKHGPRLASNTRTL